MPSLDDCPLVLAGPMVRRATDEAVSVWIALQDPRTIRLRVYGELGIPAAEGEASTLALGERLHVALVTARGSLTWGQRYSYAMELEATADSRSPATGDLFAPGIVVRDSDPASAQFEAAQRLTYVNRSRIAPGLPSFVLPPADLDALRLVHGSCRMPHGGATDELATLDSILRDTISERERPQQLFFHGDQIYADDIAEQLLERITELSTELMGWTEHFPDMEDRPLAEYEPGERDPLMMKRAGLWEPTGGCHLLGLGEFYAMYLLNWSDVLWREPTGLGLDSMRLRLFHEAMPAVRRAMANIASYMVFDDHEVSDDWNLTLEWTDGVLSRPLGRRLITNALSAFAVFQAWGNTPAQFEGDAPGRRLLDNLVERGDEDERAALLGIPEAGDVLEHDPPQLVPPTDSVRWHFRVPCASHEIVALDLRTHRAFPGGKRDAPELISARGVAEQIERPGPFEKPLTVIIGSTVLMAIPKPWYVRAAQWLGYRYKWLKKGLPDGYLDAYGPDRGDTWEGQTPAFERLIGALDRAARAGEVCSRMVWLCGDVHVGYGVRLHYWARGAQTSTVCAQLTSSPFRREKPGTRLKGRIGYGINADPPEQKWAGWVDAPRVDLTAPPPFSGTLNTPRPRGQPALLDIARPRGLLVSRPPDWIYRCDYLRAEDGRDVLGFNHLSVVSFDWTHGEVAQSMWWRGADDDPAEPHTTFRTSLDPNHPAHPKPPLTIADL